MFNFFYHLQKCFLQMRKLIFHLGDNLAMAKSKDVNVEIFNRLKHGMPVSVAAPCSYSPKTYGEHLINCGKWKQNRLARKISNVRK